MYFFRNEWNHGLSRPVIDQISEDGQLKKSSHAIVPFKIQKTG